MKNKNKLFLSGLLAIFCFVTLSAYAAPRAKPVVAIKKAKIGEGVSKYSKKFLNLSTLWDEMEASIQKNRKFTLVSRKKEVLQDIREEQEFAKSDLTAGNAAAEGQIKNANFLILPTVQDFKFYRSSKPVPNLSNKYLRVDSGMLEVNAQIIDTSTGGIKTTFYLKASFATKKQVVNGRGGAPNSIHFTKMAKKIAAQMTDQLVDAVYPMRILNVQGQQVWINRGKDGALKKGDVLKVFRPGIELIDPDTGESLGSAETEVGKIKVTRVNPKFTMAEILKDSVEPIEKGDIVRE
ncbi:MAG: hypothetical protein KZQ83_11380 [gamma proteobacterium symbiont of Taylorina sp.]|nr:hypothetical protein [gamma proteobacterium symbiont of Taylorina sp.]